jgi:6-pyruvoyltetrahydropterin/6-carboxytetrahydropterin synthase
MVVTQRYPFSAAHRLHSDVLGEDENWRVYGRCNNPYGHGHNYWLEVGVTGEVDPVSGLLPGRENLDELVEKEILARVAHRNLNIEVGELKGLVPTTENVAYVFAALLREAWPRYFDAEQVKLARIRVYETRNNVFEIKANEVL